jgi:hypothetical protein
MHLDVYGRRTRRDGWTPSRMKSFLFYLYVGMSVSASARAVGLSRESAYALRRRGGPQFAAAWDAALQAAVDRRIRNAPPGRISQSVRDLDAHDRRLADDRDFLFLRDNFDEAMEFLATGGTLDAFVAGRATPDRPSPGGLDRAARGEQVNL